MAPKTAKAAAEGDGLSKREKAISANAPKTKSVDRRPKVEMRYFYVTKPSGAIALRKQKVPINRDELGV
jgi:hypothetical protein